MLKYSAMQSAGKFIFKERRHTTRELGDAAFKYRRWSVLATGSCPPRATGGANGPAAVRTARGFKNEDRDADLGA